jgi:hypothetical protein
MMKTMTILRKVFIAAPNLILPALVVTVDARPGERMVVCLWLSGVPEPRFDKTWLTGEIGQIK